MRLWICGVRGSTPAPGAEFVRYGGATSCVAVVGNGDDGPRLVLDAGTGLRRLSRLLDGGPFRGSILLGHLHWDHTHGLPFFPSGDHPGSEVCVYVPGQGPEQEQDAEELLARAMSPPHFPIRPGELRGRWTFRSLEEDRHTIEGLDVLVREIPHKGGRTFGFRVTDDSGASVAYLSDHWPTGVGPGPAGLGEYHDAAVALAEGVDVLVHDAQYTAAELPARANFGHAAIEYAVGLAEACGVGRLLLFHHDPLRTDDDLDAIVTGLPSGPVPVTAAAEGMVVEVGGS